MAVKYQLNLSELGYLIMIAGAEDGKELQEKDKTDKELMAASRESLKKKGYIQEGEGTKMLVYTPLIKIIQLILMHEAEFSVIGIKKGGERKSFSFYFCEGRICFMEKKGNQLDLFEIPFLTLVAGMLANRIEIRDEISEIVNQASPDMITDVYKPRIEQNQIEKQWILMGKSNVDKRQCMFGVIESADSQEMLEITPEKITVSKPGKTDFVNACMDWMRKANSTVK